MHGCINTFKKIILGKRPSIKSNNYKRYSYDTRTLHSRTNSYLFCKQLLHIIISPPPPSRDVVYFLFLCYNKNQNYRLVWWWWFQLGVRISHHLSCFPAFTASGDTLTSTSVAPDHANKHGYSANEKKMCACKLINYNSPKIKMIDFF